MTNARFARLAVVGGLLLTPIDAGAQSLDDARAAYIDGRFVEAADMAEAVGTSDGYALAARSLAIYSFYEAAEDEWEEIVERAMQMGEEAVRADSTNATAHYETAHAVGRFAQGVGAWTALRQGLAGRIQDLLEAALAIDPDLADAHLAYGGWHADIAAEGFIARQMYGGDKEEAVKHFERALELAPESKVVLVEYALRLPDLDEEQGVQRAREMLEKALGLPVPDAYTDYIHLAALDALDALEGR